MLTAIRSLRQTIDTLDGIVDKIIGKDVPPDLVAVRAEEAFLSWANLRPELQQGGIDPAIVERLDTLFTSLIRDGANVSSKRTFQATLWDIREVIVGGLNDFAIKRALLPLPSAPPAAARLIPQISDLPNELFPRPLLGWIPEMQRFLGRSSFETNVFVMVAYRKKLEGLIRAVTRTVKAARLTPVIARSTNLTDDLYNPLACLLSCKYGIAIFDRGEVRQRHNANVVYELAVMQTLKRPCILLKHQDVRTMPSDILHRLYESYGTTQQAVALVKAWIKKSRPDTE